MSLKEALLEFALDKGNAPKELRNFISYLLDVGRERHIPEIISCYEDLLREEHGKVVAQVFTPKPLTQKDSAAITKELERLLQKKVHLCSSVDDKVLGGLKVQVGNTVIDCSLHHQLDILTTQVAS